MPFSYDGADCCAFVADCLKETTGENPNFRYSTEEEANQLIAEHGGLDERIPFLDCG